MKAFAFSQLLCGMVLLALLAPGWAGAQGGEAYRSGRDPYPVTTASVTLRDEKRGKDLAVRVYVPRVDGRFPIIVFSHGAGGSKDTYAELSRHWASWGYVCLHPTHADSLSQRKGRPAGTAVLVREVLADVKGWQDRARDIVFLLDSLDALEKQIPALKGRMDRKRVGVGGHSYGAGTAMYLGGAAVTLPGEMKARSFADPRVRCVLAMSGQGAGQFGFTRQSWDRFRRPFMTMTGSRDFGARGQGPDWRMRPFDAAPPGGKHHVFIEGANHFSFGGRLMSGARGSTSRLMGRLGGGGNPDAIFEWVKIATLAFWDGYLKDTEEARGYLGSENLPIHSNGKVRLYFK